MPGAAVSRAKRRLGGRLPRSGYWAAAVILAGSVARFWDLGARSWSFDEALGLLRALQPDLSSIFAAPPGVEFPFFHLLLHYWMLSGSGEAWGRALPALLSSVSLFFAWGILKRIMSRPAALGALALFALSPFQVLLAQDARPYGIVLAAQLGAFLVLLSALERPGLWKWALWSLLLAVAALAHIVAALWIPAQILFLALFRRGRRVLVPSLGWGTVALAPAVFAAYWMQSAIAHVNAASQLTDPVNYLHGILQIYGVSSFVPSAVYAPGMAVFAGLAVLGGWRLIRPDRKKSLGPPGAALIACGLFPLFVLLLANWTGFLYIPKPRYAAVSQLLLLASCAAGAFASRGRIVRSVLLSFLLLVSASSLFRYFRGAEPTLDLPPYKKPLRAVAELLEERARPDDLVASINLLTYLPLKLYLKDSVPQAYLIGDGLFMDSELERLGRPEPAEALLIRARRIWLVTAPVLYSSPPVAPPEVRKAFSADAVMAESHAFPGVSVELWLAGPRSGSGRGTPRR